jgi:type II secretory pathway pseudopilin PulG
VSRGFTLVETLLAGAIAAIAIGGLLAALSSGARFASHQAGPVREAATLLAQSTLRDAQQAWKYANPGAAPSGTFATTLPMGAPVSVSVQNSAIGTDTTQIDVTVRFTPDPLHEDDGVVLVQGQAGTRAPLPGSIVTRPGLIPMPSSAP